MSESAIVAAAAKLRRLRLTSAGGRRENPCETVRSVFKRGLGGLYDDDVIAYVLRRGLKYYAEAAAAEPAPKRIQLSRRKGWRKPAGAVVVARPSAWGNPFNWRDCPSDVGLPEWARGAAVDGFRDWLMTGYAAGDEATPERRAELLRRLPELRGRDLACWCPLDAPCHADVLLDLANRPESDA